MHLLIHELSHLIISLSIGYVVWKLYKKPSVSFFAALIGGLFVDLDHLFDYFIAFGAKFSLTYFLKGYQFMKNEKIYIPLHAWEWVVLFLIVAYLINKYTKIKTGAKKMLLSILLSFSLALFSHLMIDVWVNHVTFLGYSIIYRVKNNFDLRNLVTAEHYKNHLMEKKTITF